MRTAIFTILILVAAVARGFCGDCMQIQDENMRQLCRSQTQGQDCMQIADPDMRWYCRATKGEADCMMIEDADMRELCRQTKEEN